MDKFIIRLFINGLALFAAVYFVPGLELQNPSPVSYLVLALIFGVLNALAKPILKLLTCPLILLTLGLFSIVINLGMFFLTGWVGNQFGFGLEIDPWMAGVYGALIVALVSTVLEWFFRGELEGGRKSR